MPIHVKATKLYETVIRHYRALSDRDKRAVMAPVACMLLMLYSIIIWQPLHRGYDATLIALQKEAMHYDSISQQRNAIISALLSAPADNESASLLDTVLQTCKTHDIAITNFTSDAEGNVQVRFSGVSFTSLMNALAIIEPVGITVTDAIMNFKGNGLVDATLMFEGER